MPRPVDSGGPPHPRHFRMLRIVFGGSETLDVRKYSFRSCTSSEGATSPTISRILCLRLVHLVRIAYNTPPWTQGSIRGQVASPFRFALLLLSQQGLSPRKICRAFPGATERETNKLVSAIITLPRRSIAEQTNRTNAYVPVQVAAMTFSTTASLFCLISWAHIRRTRHPISTSLASVRRSRDTLS